MAYKANHEGVRPVVHLYVVDVALLYIAEITYAKNKLFP